MSNLPAKYQKNKIESVESKLCKILEGITGSPSGISPTTGLATLLEQQVQTTELTTLNANVISLLNNLIASQDVEILLVRDTGNGDLVVQQIREYDQGTGVWTTRYEDVSGVAYVPVGPLEYLDPSTVLNLMLTELQTIVTNTNDAATETTLSAIQVLLTTIDGVLDTIQANTVRGDLERLKKEADDLVQTISYLDAGDSVNRRVNTIVYSSVALALSVTETYAYGGGAGDYYVTSITLS